METVKIKTGFIKLDQLLKLVNMVSGGGEAKIIIKQGLVKVNNVIEYQRGKKIRFGDTVEFNGKIFEISD